MLVHKSLPRVKINQHIYVSGARLVLHHKPSIYDLYPTTSDQLLDLRNNSGILTCLALPPHLEEADFRNDESPFFTLDQTLDSGSINGRNLPVVVSLFRFHPSDVIVGVGD